MNLALLKSIKSLEDSQLIRLMTTISWFDDGGSGHWWPNSWSRAFSWLQLVTCDLCGEEVSHMECVSHMKLCSSKFSSWELYISWKVTGEECGPRTSLRILPSVWSRPRPSRSGEAKWPKHRCLGGPLAAELWFAAWAKSHPLVALKGCTSAAFSESVATD